MPQQFGAAAGLIGCEAVAKLLKTALKGARPASRHILATLTLLSSNLVCLPKSEKIEGVPLLNYT